MRAETKTRATIATLVFSMTNAVLFGVGLIVLLTVPAFKDQLPLGMIVVIVASFVLAAPLAWMIAPRLRARYWRRQERLRVESIASAR